MLSSVLPEPSVDPLLPPHDLGPPWPYPLLCLFWRLDLGGQWLTRSPAPPLETLLAAAAERPAAQRIDRPSPSPLLLRVLTRSPLGQLGADGPTAQAALDATTRLFCAGTPRRGSSRTRLAPPGWREVLAAWRPAHSRVWVPKPAPAWDPATWQLLAVLEAAWEAEGLTCLGRERPVLFRLAGTRRMATRFGWPHRRALACGRTAFRLWRHFFETQERPRIERVAGWPLPRAVQRVAGDLRLLYRQARAASRTGAPAEALGALPPPLRVALLRLAQISVASLRPPVTAAWASPDLEPLAAVLALSPLGVLAAQTGASAGEVRAAALETAERLVRALSAPWPWRPRPVVRGPRRARQELSRRRARGA